MQPTNGVCYAAAAFDLSALPARLAPCAQHGQSGRLAGATAGPPPRARLVDGVRRLEAALRTREAALLEASAAPRLSVPHRRYLPYFVSLLTELGTASRDFERLAHDMKARTAGIGAGYGWSTDLGMGGGGGGVGGGGGALGLTEATLTLSGGCLERNAGHLGELMAELCAPGSVRWRGAEDRIEELLRRRAAALGGSLGSGGGRYAALRATGALTAGGALSDELGGLHHVAHARRLATALSDGVRRLIAARSSLRLTADERAALLCLFRIDPSTTVADQPAVPVLCPAPAESAAYFNSRVSLCLCVPTPSETNRGRRATRRCTRWRQRARRSARACCTAAPCGACARAPPVPTSTARCCPRCAPAPDRSSNAGPRPVTAPCAARLTRAHQHLWQLTAWADGLEASYGSYGGGGIVDDAAMLGMGGPAEPLGVIGDEAMLLDVWRSGPSVGVGASSSSSSSSSSAAAVAAASPVRREYIGVPSQSSYVYRAVRTVPYGHADAPPLLLLAQVRSPRLSPPPSSTRRPRLGPRQPIPSPHPRLAVVGVYTRPTF